MKRNIHLTLLEVKNPTLYAEIENKVAGGMKPGEVILDLLQELHWRRELSNFAPKDNAPETETAPEQQNADFEAAINVMNGLED